MLTTCLYSLYCLHVLQKSMSGISVHDQCINAFFHMKTKSAVSRRGM